MRFHAEGGSAWQVSDVRVATERLLEAQRPATRADDACRRVEAGSLPLDVRMQGGNPPRPWQMLATSMESDGQDSSIPLIAPEEGKSWLGLADGPSGGSSYPGSRRHGPSHRGRCLPQGWPARADRHEANARPLTPASLRSLQQDWAAAGAELAEARSLQAELMSISACGWMRSRRVRLGAGAPEAFLAAALRLQGHARAQLSLTHEWRVALAVARPDDVRSWASLEGALAACATAPSPATATWSAQGGRAPGSWDAATRAQVALLLEVD